VFVAVCTAGFVAGDVVWNLTFYREMCLSLMLSPLGALLRWYLSLRFNRDNEGGGPETENKSGTAQSRWHWVPWGTVAANSLAAVVSVVCAAAYTRQVTDPSSWMAVVLQTMRLSWAGCLSTVSTWAKEVLDLATPNNDPPVRAYIYGAGTLVAGLALGLLFYCPIIRS
jgi:fluoride exporter